MSKFLADFEDIAYFAMFQKKKLHNIFLQIRQTAFHASFFRIMKV